MEPKDRNVTQLLAAWRGGDSEAVNQLMPLVYDQLQALARHHLTGERHDHTLPATALVHEAYLRLVGANVEWQDRGHFFAIASRTMRRILVDYAKSRQSARRGGGNAKLPIDEIAVISSDPPPQIVDLDEALTRLEAVDERKSRVVDLIYFGGLTQEETAAALEISPATVYRELSFATAWLVRELGACTP
jgi:RNA polymerase sigma factor (TIGR02999 family)